MFRFAKVGLAGIAIAVLAVGAVEGSVITTLPDWDGSSNVARTFGVVGTPVYGQTFTVEEDNVLTSVTLNLQNTYGYVAFSAYVAEWVEWIEDNYNTGCISTAYLEQIGVGSTTDGSEAWKEVKFDNLSLGLTTGQKYVVYLCAEGDINTGIAKLGGFNGGVDEYGDGEFVYDDGLYLESKWELCADDSANRDAAFEITFEAGSSPVPEPASLALWGTLGCIGLVTGYRKRRHA